MIQIHDPPIVEPAVENNPKHEDLRRKAEKWIAENPEGYETFLCKARTHLEFNESFTAKGLAEEARQYSATNEWPFEVNNDLIAYIARRLIEDIPEAAKYLHFRKTRW